MEEAKNRRMTIHIYVDEWVQNDYFQKHPDMCIEAGCVVKLRNPLNELFFVVVVGKEEKGWIGRVNNHLVNSSEYNYGDLVSFANEDVYDFKSLEVVNAQRQNPCLILAFQLISKFLEEKGIINDSMSVIDKSILVDLFIARYPEKFNIALEMAPSLLLSFTE